MWFKRKKDPELEIVTNDIPLTTVFRWYLYDTDLTDNVNELADLVGLPVISEEGDEKEREDSDARIENIAPLYAFLESMADWSATTMSAIHVKEIMAHEPVEDDKEFEETVISMHKIYKAIALSSLLGTVSVALELGILRSDTVGSDTFIVERDNDNE